MGRAVPAVGRALDILELFLDEERWPGRRRRPPPARHCTGVGKVLLSGLDPAALRARYPRGRALPAMTPRSITSPQRLRACLADVRELGLAYDERESNDAVHCVAAPVQTTPAPRWRP